VKDDRPYLLHIRDAVGKIEEYTKDGREVFFIDSMTQDALEVVERDLPTLRRGLTALLGG
jgi:uncharacterized protein with HEPN domain